MTQTQCRADCSVEVDSAPVLEEVTLLFHKIDQKLSVISEQDPIFQEIVQTRNALRYLRDTKLQRRPFKQPCILDVSYLRHLAYSWRGYLTPIRGWLQLFRSKQIDTEQFLRVIDILLRNIELQCETVADLEAGIDAITSLEATTAEEAKLLGKVDLFIHS